MLLSRYSPLPPANLKQESGSFGSCMLIKPDGARQGGSRCEPHFMAILCVQLFSITITIGSMGAEIAPRAG